MSDITAYGGDYWMDERSWIVTYFARSRSDASTTGEAWYRTIKQSPTSHDVIPLWIFNFPYFAPLVFARTVSPGSSFGAGTYSVQLVAEDPLGNVSLASAVSSVTISAGQGIEVQVPLEPAGYPLARKFHVYLSGSGTTPSSAHRVATINYTGGGEPDLTLVADVPNGTSSGNAPALLANLASNSEIRYRYMRVISLRAEIVEDQLEEGLYNHIVRMRTQTVSVRYADHAQNVDSISVPVP